MSKKKDIMITAVFAVMFCAMLISFNTISKRNIMTIASIDNQAPTIILDPGHGGIDGGAVSADKTEEKHINLAISLKLRDILVLNGFNVTMTRETDVSIHDKTAVTIKQQKTSDIKNRLKILNNAVNPIFLSVHQNFFEQSKYWGAQIFYGPKNENSEKLAKILQASFINNLQPESKRQHKKATNDLYLLSHATSPAVLIECGFLSNPQDTTLLKDDEYQSKVAFIIYSGLMEYLRTQNT